MKTVELRCLTYFTGYAVVFVLFVFIPFLPGLIAGCGRRDRFVCRQLVAGRIETVSWLILPGHAQLFCFVFFSFSHPDSAQLIASAATAVDKPL